MNKKLFLLFAVIAFLACNKKEVQGISLSGTVESDNVSNLFLYDVINQHYRSVILIDSIAVTGGKFSYSNDSLQPKLYFLSAENIERDYNAINRGTFFFPRKGDNEMIVSIDADNKPAVNIKESPLQEQLVAFTEELRRTEHSTEIDSLEQLFFAARERGDQNELIRIKTLSEPYYDEVDKKVKGFINTKIEENKSSLFGLYLFYTYRFQNGNFSTLEEISKIREYLANMNEEAKKNPYFDKIEKQLSLIENCAVGHEAPEIAGLDTLDNEIKLSDFRGKYVLVDFWSSSCSWCRLETPHFQKIQDKYKDKNVVILGVSSDYKKDDWIGAIHEDKSYWNQIMMRQQDMKKIMDSYVIVGIPEILLVDPQGIILAKGLRGEDIYNAVAEHVK